MCCDNGGSADDRCHYGMGAVPLNRSFRFAAPLFDFINRGIHPGMRVSHRFGAVYRCALPGRAAPDYPLCVEARTTPAFVNSWAKAYS